jgi:drug/metabolite transporter (DMT)-like permease
VTCTAVWGGFAVVAKVALSDAPPQVLASWRFLFAGLLLLPWLWVRRALPRRPRGREWAEIALLAFLGVFCHNLLLFFGLVGGSAFEGSLVTNAVIPIVTPWFASWARVERLDARRIPGMLIATLGVGLIFAGTHVPLSLGSKHLVGLLCFVAAGFDWSGYTVLSRKAQRAWRPAELTAWVTWVGMLMLLPFGLYAPLTVGLPSVSAGLAFRLGYLSILNTIVAFFMWQSGVATVGPARSAALVYLVPVFTIVLGGVFLDERPAALQLAGGGLAIGGVLWASRRELFARGAG